MADPLRLQDEVRRLVAGVTGARAEVYPEGDVFGVDAAETLARLVGWLAVVLQNHAGAKVTEFGAGRRPRGEVHALCAYEDPGVGRAAMPVAAQTVAAVLRAGANGELRLPEAIRHATANLIEIGGRAHLGFHHRPTVELARQRGIPVYPVRPPHPLMQFGQGARQRHFVQVMGDGYDHLGTIMCRDKQLTSAILRRIGIPVPEQRRADSVQQAKRIAAALGYPVVLKPAQGFGGKGVTVDVRDAGEIEAAFARAEAQHAGPVIVERFVEGHDYRLLLVDGRLVAATQRIAGHVVGDGVRSVAELIALVNTDPRRGTGGERVLVRLEADDEAVRMLARRGYDLSNVPPAGEVVFLRATANVSTGGIAVDVIDRVHPSVREIVEVAARAFKVSILAIDYLSPDISRPGGVFCEVNESPGLRPHAVAGTNLTPIIEGILDRVFPPGDTGRIPTVMITGTSGKSTTARMVAAMLRESGLVTGLACSDGVFVGSRVLRKGDSAGASAAQMLLYDPTVEAAVMEVARGGIIRYGLPLDRCYVAAVLNVTRDHIGQDGVETVEELACVKSLVLGTATRLAVLNADDPHCLAMADKAAAPVCWVSMSAENATVASHLATGGEAVFLEGAGPDSALVLACGAMRSVVARVGAVPATWNGRLAPNIANAMHAAAIGHGLGLDVETIAAGLGSFRNDFRMNPGRFSLLRAGARHVILDRSNSVADLQVLVAFLAGLPAFRRRILAFTYIGNRLDEDVAAFARTTIEGRFDHYVCYDWTDLRGRRPGEITGLLASELARAGIAAERISPIQAESEAIARAVALAEPADLVVLAMSDEIDELRPILEAAGVDGWDCGDLDAWLEGGAGPDPADMPPRA